MSDRKFYVLCADNCKFESMTKEQILAAIEQAVSTGKITDVDTGFVTSLKEQNANKALTFWVGTTAEYNALSEKADNCFYILTDDTMAEDIKLNIEEIKNDISSLNTKFTDTSQKCNDIDDRTLKLETEQNKKGVVLYGGEGVPYGEYLRPEQGEYVIENIIKYSLVKVKTTGNAWVICNVEIDTTNNTYEITGAGNSTAVSEEAAGVTLVNISGNLKTISGVVYGLMNTNHTVEVTSASTDGGVALNVLEIVGIM